MKIVYLIGEDIRRQAGPVAKIQAQIAQWKLCDHEVHVLHHSSARDSDETGAAPALLRSAHRMSSQLKSLQITYRNFRQSIERIKPHLIYSRYLFPAPNLVEAIGAAPLVVEVNSDDVTEYLHSRYLTGIYNKAFRHRFLNRAKGLVFVTNELSNSPHFRRFSTKRTVIANAVDERRFGALSVPNNAEPNLCMITSGTQSWQGLEKVMLLARLAPQFKFHIVGLTEQQSREKYHCSQNVAFHGFQSQDYVDRLLANMDVGISTLALHRKAMNESASVKSRDYASFGLPYISAYADPDVPPDAEFCLQLPNCEDNIQPNIDRIVEFVEAVRRSPDIRRRFQQFARANMSTAIKESKRLAFFDDVLSKAT